jgi:hypothetical protein
MRLQVDRFGLLRQSLFLGWGLISLDAAQLLYRSITTFREKSVPKSILKMETACSSEKPDSRLQNITVSELKKISFLNTHCPENRKTHKLLF